MHQFIQTEDGSTTLYVPELNEHYHSVHGAIQESLHIFIQAGIEHYGHSEISILEAGFGTGLNAWLTIIYAEEHQKKINYHSIEKYPLTENETNCLNYKDYTQHPTPELFGKLHHCRWEEDFELTPYFCFHKHQNDFREITFPPSFDIVFFDAFNPDVQPHLWTEEVFQKFYDALKPNGILVTYCVKGIVKQALRNVGFTLKRLPGPPGKREMLRATKPES